MKIAFFDTHQFEKPFFEEANKRFGHEITYFEPRLTVQTAPLVRNFPCVCCFVNDVLDAQTLCALSCEDFKVIALRSAGYNNVDLEEAYKLGLTVVRVPSYSPHAVAEHAVGLLLALDRKIPKAYARVHELNFSLDGLVGFDLYDKTIGVIGTGKIGSIFSKIMRGFDCNVLAFDIHPSAELSDRSIVRYVDLDELFRESDIISLHTPLTPQTHHLIDTPALTQMKPGAILINTGRGALIDSHALLDALKNLRLGGAALDVYEEEEGVFFQDLSDKILRDDVLARLILFPNVIITSHQAFLTREALRAIAETALGNVADFEKGRPLRNEVRPEHHIRKAAGIHGESRGAA